MADLLIDKLADHVESFSCTVYVDGRLIIFTDPPPWGNRKRGKHVGQAREVGYMDWRIESLKDNAPDYLKPLVGKSFDGMNLLNDAVRRAAFVAEFKRGIKEFIS